MATEFHLTQITAPTATPTFLQWQADASGKLRLVLEPQLICPGCGSPCGFLYKDEDTPQGACLSCKIDDDVVAHYEAEEADMLAAETVCTCGVD